MSDTGTVYLVGAGPGDPELLTLKAHRLIRSADAVVYDRLVSSKILDLIPEGRIRIDVGKTPGAHPVPQVAINRILMKLAKSGHSVVRLKGGDPMIFGRGGEEAKMLLENGIEVKTIPGITAAQGCAASLNLALTERGVADSVIYLTGHTCKNLAPEMNWSGLALRKTTIVIYMGVANISLITQQMQASGFAPSTPVLAICNGTLPHQQHIITCLENHEQDIENAGFDGPVLFIIGDAVKACPQDAAFDCAEIMEKAVVAGL